MYSALGFSVVRRWEGCALLDRGGERLTLQGDAYIRSHPHYFTGKLDGARGVGVEVIIEVDDVDDVFATASRFDGAVVKGLQDRSWDARDFRIADPDGYFVRLTTPLQGK